jgi:hypothetical protein
MCNSENDGLHGNSIATGFHLLGFQVDGLVDILMDGQRERERGGEGDSLRAYTYKKRRIVHMLIQEGRSIFWEVIVSVIMKKRVHMNVCLILNGYRDRAV